MRQHSGFLVEAVGIEPTSEKLLTQLYPGAEHLLFSRIELRCSEYQYGRLLVRDSFKV